MFYDFAEGESGSEISVNKDTEIDIGPAYGKVEIEAKEGGILFEIKRLRVKINGKTGFVERPDYRKIGLPAFG